MVIISLIGDEGVGKTSILRSFLRSVEEGVKKEEENNLKIFLINQDFDGEDEIKNRTINPNRIVFREDASNERHTILAPGGRLSRAIIKMGIIVTLRLSTCIIAVFSLGRDLSNQFEFFKNIRYYNPGKFYVCLSKYDFLEGSNLEKKEKTEKIMQKITVFFKLNDRYTKNKPIEINKFFITSRSFPESITKMILDVVHLEEPIKINSSLVSSKDEFKKSVSEQFKSELLTELQELKRKMKDRGYERPKG
jgi:hypothetical protein